MITDYAQHRPGTSIEQILAAQTASSVPDITGCIIGPQFLLNRYGREDLVDVEFNAAGQNMTFQRLVDDIATTLDLDDHSVDMTSLKVYGKKLEAALATFTAAGTPSLKLADLSESNVLQITNSNHVKGSSLAGSFRGRPVTVGDLVYCTGINGGTTFRRKVTGLRGVVGAGTFGANAAGTDSNAGNVSSNPLTTVASATEVSAPANWAVSCAAPEDFAALARGARYLGYYGEEFIITVHTAGAPATATVNIASASGLFNATNVATADSSGNFSITDDNANGELGGVDLLLTTPGAALSVGMSFRIQIYGNYERLSTAQMIPAGTYTGTKNTMYVVEVTQKNTAGTSFTGAKVSVTDTAGIDTPQTDVTVTDNTAFDLGSFGLTFKLYGSGQMPDQAGLRVGDKFYVRAIAGAVSTTNFDKIVLDGPAVDTLVFTNVATELYSVSFRLEFTGEIAATAHSGGTAWELNDDEDAVVISAALDHYISTRDDGYRWCAFATGEGDLCLSWRAAVKVTDDDGLVAITEAADITELLGDVDLDNPLAFAAQQCLLGAQGKLFYVLNTGGELEADFTAAFAKIANDRSVYDLCVLTQDADICEAALAHAVSASSNLNRNFRRIRVGIDSPGEYVVLNKRADTTNFTCTISPHGGGNKLVTIIDGADESLITTKDIKAGDLLKLTASAEEYVIDEIISDYELTIVTGPAAEVDPDVACEIWKADTVASQKAFLVERATALADRRISLVWVERGTAPVNGTTTVIPAMYGAAFLTGLRSYLKPQVGMTRQTVSTYSAAPNMYKRYSETDLNDLAAVGVQILEQARAGTPVRVRHQVTTDTSNGILNLEETTTVRLDLLAWMLDSRVDATIGPVNTTQAAADDTRAAVLSELAAAKLVPVGASYGPLIDDFKDLVVGLSATFLDRIETTVSVGIGPPVNRQYVTLTAYGRLPADA